MFAIYLAFENMDCSALLMYLYTTLYMRINCFHVKVSFHMLKCTVKIKNQCSGDYCQFVM